MVQKRSWNSLLIQLHKLSRGMCQSSFSAGDVAQHSAAYSESILVSNFYNAFASSQLSLENLTVVRDLFQLYALHTIDADARSFTTSNAIDPASLDAIPDKILQLMTERIRPHAIKLVDSWAIPEYLLNSALGRHDGKVYEALYDMAHRQNPLNEVTFNPDWRSDEIVLGSSDGGRHILAKL